MPRITDVETFLIDVPLERSFEQSQRSVARATEVLVKVHTDDGTEGIGTGAALHTVRGPVDASPLVPVAEVVARELTPVVVGQDPLAIERLWQRMFALTMDRTSPLSGRSGTVYPKGRDRAGTMAAIAAVDIALWDLAGKLHGEPLWRLLGGYRSSVPAYTTGGYYAVEDDPDALAAEFTTYVDTGFMAVKLKAGGRTPEVDVERARVVREAIGPDVELFIDAHAGWSVRDAITAGRLYEELGVGWYEEPAPWYDDVDGLARIARHVRIPITSGESEHTRQGCTALIDRGLISITNFDCTKAGGISEGRKLAVVAQARDVEFAPHHAGHVHAHLTAAVPNGRIVETHSDPTRDPLAANLYREHPRFEDGELVLGDRPGLGVVLDEDYLASVSTRIA